MEPNLNSVISEISKEKGISREVLIEALEAAILAAARKVFGQNRQFETRFNEETGQVELFQYMRVTADVQDPEQEINLDQAHLVDEDAMDGDELGFEIFYSPLDQDKARDQELQYGDILGISSLRSTFGRIAAQTAKQVINQRVRSAEREIVFNEYKGRKHELVTGIARRFERGDIIVDLGKAEAILPLREQVPKESYRAGDRVQAFVLDVLDSEHSVKGSQVVLSRRHPFLVVQLFEMEVPEIYEAIVKVVSVAREPGERTKIAVTSTDSDVDPVGACVGMRGARVQAVVQELKGEKIDIVPYSPDLARFVCNAIAPAEVARVLIDEDTNTIELIVPDDQLSLAIGRRGQNVKLASQLVGWNIEIHSESQIQEQKRGILDALLEDGVMEAMDIEYMFKLGLHSIENILGTPDEELLELPGIKEETLPKLREALADLRERRIEEEERRRADMQLAAATAAATAAAAAAAPPPVVPETAPLEGEATPLEGEAAPLEGEAAPLEGEAAPIEDEATPFEDEPDEEEEPVVKAVLVSTPSLVQGAAEPVAAKPVEPAEGELDESDSKAKPSGDGTDGQ